MKKRLLLLFLCVVIISGCGASKQEKDFKKYALDYYQNYMQKIDMDVYQVTISMLKNSNRLKKTDYDLNRIEDCDKDSYVNITVKNDKVNYEVKLKCN